MATWTRKEGGREGGRERIVVTYLLRRNAVIAALDASHDLVGGGAHAVADLADVSRIEEGVCEESWREVEVKEGRKGGREGGRYLWLGAFQVACADGG